MLDSDDPLPLRKDKMKTLPRFACIAALLSLASALNLASAANAPDEKAPPAKDAAAEALADGDFKIAPRTPTLRS